MVDYDAWRGLESDFRAAHREHSEVVADGDTIGTPWAVHGSPEGAGGEERFTSLAEIAAAQAGYRGESPADHWLNLVKDYLLSRNSKNIHRHPVASATGLPAKPASLHDSDAHVLPWSRDDPRIKHGEAYRITGVYQTSADYCLERAKRAKVDQMMPIGDFGPASVHAVSPPTKHNPVSAQLPSALGKSYPGMLARNDPRDL